MKKISFLFFLFFTSSSFAIMVSDFDNVCGNYKYDKIYAVFEPNSYTCTPNYYLPKQSTDCTVCSNGFTCNGGTFSYSETTDQGKTPIPYTCDSGYFLPADSTSCTICPNGWSCSGGTFGFSPTEYSGLTKNEPYMAGDENGGCAANYGHKIYAVFEPNSYTCDSGYFLPAATAECAACPDGYSCPGGTYTYNPMHAQGLIQNAEYYTANENNACAANFPHNLIAVFVENINCDAGQYLPANTNTCVECPAGNACPGGSYSFNAPIDQGIQSCTGTGFAPDKSAVCYPHLMHVGNDKIYLRSEKSTTPSLNVKIGNDIFYANMSSTRTKMNKDSAHYFRARWENNDYYICDDTTCPQ